MANLSSLGKLLLATVQFVEAGLLQMLLWWVAKPAFRGTAGLLPRGRLELSAKSPGKLKMGSAGRCYRSNLTVKYRVIISSSERKVRRG